MGAGAGFFADVTGLENFSGPIPGRVEALTDCWRCRRRRSAHGGVDLRSLDLTDRIRDWKLRMAYPAGRWFMRERERGGWPGEEGSGIF
jgi:hypothetical protein